MSTMRFLLFAMLLVFANLLVGQTTEYQFNHFKTLGENNIVYIKIADLGNDVDEHDRVLAVLLNDENIADGQIYSSDDGNPTCQIEVSGNVSVAYLRSLLQTVGYDIDLESVGSSNPGKPDGIFSSESFSFFDGFDGLKGFDYNSADAVSTEDYYGKNKEEWIKNNSDSYEKAKLENGTQVIVTRKDLEFFKEEKRQHILSHPEIYIIED